MSPRRKSIAATRQILSLAVAVGVCAASSATLSRAQPAESSPTPDTIAPSTPSIVNGIYVMAPIRSAGDPGVNAPADPPGASAPALPQPAPITAAPLPPPAPAPSVVAAPQNAKPVVQAVSVRPLTASQRANVRQGFAAMKRGDWGKARAYTQASGNAVAQAIVQWRFLLDDASKQDFDAIDAFLAAHGDWPRRDGLIARAEQAMPPDLPPKQVIAWFGARAPVTGIGMVRLGDALLASGKTKEGRELIRAAWVGDMLSIADEKTLLKTHGDMIDPRAENARLDRVLSHDDIAEAKRQMARVDQDVQRLAQARIRLKTTRSTIASINAAVPASLRDDPELLFDEARALRRRGEDEEAWRVMLKAPTDPKKLTIPEHWWNERHIMARDALKAGKYDIAYEMASKAVTTSNADASDAQFLSGWIALRFLNKPDLALGHFQALADTVSLPLSVARAQYWIGRSEEALNRPGAAIEAYKLAAKNPATYYGQLALARIDDTPMLHLASATEADDPPAQSFDADERVQAIRLLADSGERDLARLFAIRIANDVSAADHLERLASLMRDVGDPAMSVRVAKIAGYSNVLLTPYLAPMIPIPEYRGASSAPEAPLVLGLTRQESEFDPAVVSSAGARGLMQLMPATARQAAKALGLPYRPNDLTGKSDYNLQLGMASITDYLSQWDGSYILAIASYNAGAGNVRDWVEANGDPRDPGVDPIDWVEMIPFGETRNYVQRVLENIEIYRNRIAGSDQRLSILTDLYRPATPKLAVLKAPPSTVIPASAEAPLNLAIPFAAPLVAPADK